jgi:hypothetical protein
MTLTIELTPNEAEVLQMIATANGLDPADYVRQSLFCEGPKGDLYITEAEQKLVMAMLEELRQTGVRISESIATINTNTNEMLAMLREPL